MPDSDGVTMMKLSQYLPEGAEENDAESSQDRQCSNPYLYQVSSK